MPSSPTTSMSSRPLPHWTAGAPKVTRSRLPAFVKTISSTATASWPRVRLGINNARAEGLNNHLRLIIRRAYGFHSARAALALVILSCGPLRLRLPHEPRPT